jgi:FkbM family methyltransferase
MERMERISASAQGKGYGTATVKQEVKSVLQLLGRPPQLAIDIGGNVGQYTAELRRISQHSEIHIFEPSATNIAKLQARFGKDAAIVIVPLAVSDASGSATLFSNEPGAALSSLTKRNLEHFNISFDTTEKIHTIRFEEYWEAMLSRRPIDIVKLDIEGHELAALAGFGEAINAIKVIQFEFGGCNIDTRTFFQGFWRFFIKTHQFTLFRITPFGVERMGNYRESDEYFSTTNYIAVAES